MLFISDSLVNRKWHEHQFGNLRRSMQHASRLGHGTIGEFLTGLSILDLCMVCVAAYDC